MIIEINFYIGIIDSNNNLVVEYRYDAYGKLISITDTTSNNIGEKNPYRYRSYYYDTETTWYYLNSRYYDPLVGRFITMDEIEYLGATSTIQSYNLFTYCEGNPINMVDESGTVPISVNKFFVEETAVVSTSVATVVSMTNYSTTLVDNISFGMALGNISHTTTIQHNNSGAFYAYSNIGNSTSSVGVGLNIKDWYGSSAYISSNIGMGSSMQLGSNTYGAEISVLDGISFSFGTVTGNVTNETTVSIGWGTLAFAYAACGAIAATPVPFARAVAAVAVCVVVLIDIFN